MQNYLIFICFTKFDQKSTRLTIFPDLEKFKRFRKFLILKIKNSDCFILKMKNEISIYNKYFTKNQSQYKTPLS